MINEIHILLKQLLKNTKFANNTYFVGGCVRDYYREVNANDIDIVVSLENGAKELAYFIYDFIKTKYTTKVNEYITNPYQLGHYPIYSLTFKNDISFNNEILYVKDITIEIADSMDEIFSDANSRQPLPGILGTLIIGGGSIVYIRNRKKLLEQ